MRLRQTLGLLALGLAAGQVAAQSVDQTSFDFRRPIPRPDCVMPVPETPRMPPADPDSKDQAPKVDQAPKDDDQAFAQAPAAGGELGTSFNPAMFGDLVGGGLARINRRTLSVIPVTTTTRIPDPTDTSGTRFITITSTSNVTSETVETIQVPLVGRGGFKISENESPRPTDRAFLTYNYFDGVRAGGTDFGLHRETIGFEKTFLGGDASFGLRLPFLQSTGAGTLNGFDNQQVGDITLIGRYALINDRETGDVLSGGLALTVPSADQEVVLADGRPLRPALFQPWGGWIINSTTIYAHGFHALIVPTDSRDITSLNNDVGVGYWLYRNSESFLRGVTPSIEGHLYTPLDHRTTDDLVYAPNVFTVTAGVNFVMPNNTTLGAALAAPVTGPRPNNVEGIVSFNFRF